MRHLPARPARGSRLLLVIAIIAVFLVPLAAGAAPSSSPSLPHAPRAVRASVGTTGTIAVVRWAGEAGASGYRVWRAERAKGDYRPIGSSVGASFRDVSGIPGRSYFYRVTALSGPGLESAGSTPAGPVEAKWNLSPHATYAKGNLCATCHGAGSETGAASGEVKLCESCHDGQGARTDVKDGPEDSFALASGHAIEQTKTAGDLTNACSSCHSPHADPKGRRGLYKSKIDGHRVTGGDSWCLACHDDAASWSPGYPGTANPVRALGSYPLLGTFPGATVYSDEKANAHANLRVDGGRKGDCLICHAAHRGPNQYDGLLLTFRPPSASTLASDRADGTYAELCLTCHGGQARWKAAGAANIRGYVTGRADGSYLAHSIVTSGGTLPAGSPIPCYDCHNPHGSARGNASMIADDLGAGLSTKTPAGVRAFCLSCHSTSDGMVWDSTKKVYAPVGDELFEGLRRDGTRGNALRLRETKGHEASSAKSCDDCHGADYGKEGANVHAPARPVPAEPELEPAVGAGTPEQPPAQTPLRPLAVTEERTVTPL